MVDNVQQKNNRVKNKRQMKNENKETQNGRTTSRNRMFMDKYGGRAKTR